jgi:putative hydrolase of the HAD superfamily
MNVSGDHTSVPWDAIDTVLMDMDGTLLDLNYDNQIFAHRLPAAFAKHHGLTLEAASQQLGDHMAKVSGTMDFYRLNYWRDLTGIDILALHEQAANLVCFLPGAAEFLQTLSEHGKRTLIVTNADRQSFAIKDRVLRLSPRVNQVISSHDLGIPKEENAFWVWLTEQHDLNPSTTLFVDDTARVLRAAEIFGIAHTLAVAQPDQQRPPRDMPGRPSFGHYDQLIAELA